jgi:hypothetical protein|tara:strand:- start:423 stop:638 length:216 start_codon:yes stop_codon:yes gene_type:complete
MAISTIHRAVERGLREREISDFKKGVSDGLFRGTMNDSDREDRTKLNTQFYYTRGYDFGVSLFSELNEEEE